MKYLILHGEGLMDQVHPELGGKTPLQAASTPHMDRLVGAGELGLMATPSDGTMPSQEETTLGLLGYDPRKFPGGPAPFEAIGLGVALGQQDVTFRCNMVTLRPSVNATKGGAAYPEMKKFGPQLTLEDDTAGGITTEEARELIDAVNEQLGSETIQFYPGTGHRHFMVWVGGKAKAICVDPHEVVGRSIGEALPTGEGADILRRLMEASLDILGTHPANDQRQETGLKPANCLWLWGQGRAPTLPTLPDRFRVDGAVLSPNDLVRGIGACAGLEAVSPEEFVKSGQAELPAQVERALHELQKRDFLYLHIELPRREADGEDPQGKSRRLEDFDRDVVGVMVDGLKKMGTYRVLLVGEGHATVRKPGVTGIPALYALVLESTQGARSGARRFNEPDAEAAQGGVRDATKLVARLFSRV